MTDQWERTRLLIGEEGLEALRRSHVIIFGIGGVGGFVAEALARAGVGNLDLVDNDAVSETNINRQIIATHRTVGQSKTKLMKKRIEEIDPSIKATAIEKFFLPDNSAEFDFTKYDYVVDAVDTVAAKIELAVRANEAGVPIISSMGTGNKADPTRLEVADIYETSVCPLARVMRKELRERGIEALKTVYSREEPIRLGKTTPGSLSFVPSAAGLIIAGEVIKDIIKWER